MTKNSSAPQISVLIPIYNVEKYVERCLLSVLNQTLQEGVEVIIVDDCTPDHSMEIIQRILVEYSDKIRMTVRIIEHVRNRGQAAVRNTLMSHAKGEYILFIDSDDYVDTDMLEKMYVKATETGADIVMVDILKEYSDKEKLQKIPYYQEKSKILSSIIRDKNSYLWNKLIRRSLYVENRICWTEGMDMWDDYSVVVPLCYAAHRIEFVPDVYYHYVQYNMSAITKRKVTQKEIAGRLDAIEKLDKLVREKGLTGVDWDVAYIKLKAKLWCMKNSQRQAQREYRYLYPELALYKWGLLQMYPGKFCKLLLRIALIDLFSWLDSK